MPAGAGSGVPALRRPFSPSEAKSRELSGTARRSRSFALPAGTKGCERIATYRTTSAVVQSTVAIFAGSDLRNSHGALAAKYWFASATTDQIACNTR